MDELTMKEKYQGIKTDIPKRRFLLRGRPTRQHKVYQSLWRRKNNLLPQGQPHQQNIYGK
jgi:hypothetical protein